MARLSEVFGISTKPILSYVERPVVDGTFREALDEHHHIVVYGSSKQGKTALRQKHIPEKNCTVIRCGPNTTQETVYQAMLRAANVRIETFETNMHGVKAGTKAKWGFRAFLPWVAHTDVDAEIAAEGQAQHAMHTEIVGYDLADAQAITELLTETKYNKFVVLENFHYLTPETQRSIAFDLKTFHEVGIRFIVLGIWQEADLLLVYNGDLAERVCEIPVEPWEDEDFERVVACGSRHLNITIPVDAIGEFTGESYGNIGMFQEFLKKFCQLNGIEESPSTKKVLANGERVEQTLDAKVKSLKSRLLHILQSIAGKSRTDGTDPLILPYYLAQVVLSAPIEELRKGIRRQDLLDKIRQLHHRANKETIRVNDISHLLRRLPSHQENIQPPFFYYDPEQQRLRIVDMSQFFVLTRVDRDELKQDIPNPLESYDS